MKYLLSITTAQLATNYMPNNWLEVLVNGLVSIATVYIYTKFKK